jgi:mRNA-degrading endonuclease toxin of MazEF toxin-antitoxin module
MSPAAPPPPKPNQGEIWVVKIPSEPEDKGPRYVIVVSPNAQNHHARATTVLVVPLSTTLSKNPQMRLRPGETGLQEESELWPSSITTVKKESLRPPRNKLRTLSHGKVCEIAACVVRAMGILPSEILTK